MISLFESVKNTSPSREMDFLEYLKGVKTGLWAEFVDEVRKAKGTDSYSEKKAKSPLVTMSGTFTSRKSSNLKLHSGLIAMDIDFKDNEKSSIDSFKVSAMFDEKVYAVHDSIGGDGLVIIYKIDPARHLESFIARSEHLKSEYNLSADKSCKDVSRARYVSHDSQAYYSKAAPVWSEFITEVKEDKRVTRKYKEQEPDLANAVRIAKEVAQKNPNALDDYSDWMRIGFSIIDGFGDDGREVFHALSSGSDKYDASETDIKYTQLMSEFDGSSITVGSFFHLAKENGVELIQQAEILIDPSSKPDEVLEYIRSYMDENPKANSDAVEELAYKYIESYGLRTNEITGMAEDRYGNLITDSFESYVLGTLRRIVKLSKLNRTTINDTVSFFASRRVNPLVDELTRLANTPSQGVLDAFIDTLIPNKLETQPEFKKALVKKWLVSLVASVMGERCELCLVLVGEQGNGKTTFFTNLLPEGLKSYSGLGSFDNNKDNRIRMSQKMLIINDEMVGMSRHDWNNFKALSSVDYIDERKAYGRRSERAKRIAVFAGATNDTEFLSDVTGNRRVVPFNLERLEYDAYMELDKELLFSELMTEYLSDKEFSWRLTADEVLKLKELSSSENRFIFEDEVAILENFQVPTDKTRVVHELSSTQVRDVLAFLNPVLRSTQPSSVGKTLRRLGFSHRTLNGKSLYKVEDITGILNQVPSIGGHSVSRGTIVSL